MIYLRPGSLRRSCESSSDTVPYADVGMTCGSGELAGLRRGNEGGPHHAVRGDGGQPLHVGKVAPSARRVLHVLRVAQPKLVEHRFEGIVRTLATDARRLRRHGGDRGVGGEGRELAETVPCRGEALFRHLDFTVGIDPTARDNCVVMDVDPATDRP